MLERVRDRLLGGWARLVTGHPWLVLLVAAVLAATALYTTITRFAFEPDRNALISPHLDWNQRFERWRQSFPGNEDMYVVIDSGPTDAADRDERIAEARAAVDHLGPVLHGLERTAHAAWGYPTAAFSERTLRMEAWDAFTARLEEIAASQPVLASPTPGAMLQTVMDQLKSSQDDAAMTDEQAAAQIDVLTAFLSSAAACLASPAEQRDSFGELFMRQVDGGDDPWVYMTSDNGRLYFIRITASKTGDDALTAIGAAIEHVRDTLDDAAQRFPGVAMGLTGIDVVETDETEVATVDSAIASGVASVLITVLLITAFHSWRTPLMAMIALLTGIAWSFGYLFVAIGHLQVLSVVFAVILLGLGIAYGIHLAARLELVRHEHPDTVAGFAEAMADCFRTTGPGILTGAVTTAAAFVTTLFTDFAGVAEMGHIAAVGIVLCLIAMFAIFPALLRLVRPHHRHVRRLEDRRLRFYDERWSTPFIRRPVVTIVVIGALTLASLAIATRMRFDYDLMKLYPTGVDSVHWQERIERDGGGSIWTGTVIADDLAQARRITQALRDPANDLISEVRGIALLMPADEPRKIESINATRNRLGDALDQALADEADDPRGPGLRGAVGGVRFEMTLGAGMIPDELRPAFDRLRAALDRIGQTLARLDAPTRADRLTQLDREYAAWRLATAQRIDQALDTAPLTPADVPDELLRPYIADRGPLQGKLALEVYPAVPRDEPGIDSALSPRLLPRFIAQMNDVIADVPDIERADTGVVVQIYRSGDLIRTSYERAGLYALLVVFVLVWLDFRSVHDAMLCLMPVAVGFAITFAVMWLLGRSVNPANIIVLPLMFGIGVDSGVHVLHRVRQQPDGAVPGMTQGTGKGITITSMTTIIGFGAMTMARHQGIADLGFTLAFGIAMTMLACWTLMPAWLRLRQRRSAARS